MYKIASVLFILGTSPAFAECENYDENLSSSPKAILCYKGKCDKTYMTFQCGNTNNISSGYGNGLFIKTQEKGTIFYNKFRKMKPEDWTCREITKNSCLGFPD